MKITIEYISVGKCMFILELLFTFKCTWYYCPMSYCAINAQRFKVKEPNDTVRAPCSGVTPLGATWLEPGARVN